MPIKAYPGKVLVEEMEQGEEMTSAGIFLKDDNGTSEGVRARWAKVYAIGEGVEGIEGTYDGCGKAGTLGGQVSKTADEHGATPNRRHLTRA